MIYRRDIIIYDIIINITVPLEQLIDAHTIIPTLRGIKYTSLDLSQFSKCLTHCGGKMQMFYGCDEVCHQLSNRIIIVVLP